MLKVVDEEIWPNLTNIFNGIVRIPPKSFSKLFITTHSFNHVILKDLVKALIQMQQTFSVEIRCNCLLTPDQAVTFVELGEIEGYKRVTEQVKTHDISRYFNKS